MGAVNGHKAGESRGCVCGLCKDLEPITPLEAQIEALPKKSTRDRLRRFLAYRGTLTAFAASEGVKIQTAHQFVMRMSRRGGPLFAAIDHARVMRHSGLKDVDLVPCTACSLRGHVAGEPGRCSGLTGTGIGQSAWMAEGGW